MATLAVSTGCWLALVGQTALGAIDGPESHAWLPGSQVAAAGTVVLDEPAPPVSRVNVDAIDEGALGGVPDVVPEPLMLPLDPDPDPLGGRVVVGAYDPEQMFEGMPLALRHWFVLEGDPRALQRSLDEAARSRSLPLITIEPWPAGSEPSVLQRVANGDADDEIAAMAATVSARKPDPVLVRWAHEMDLIDLYPWSTDDAALYRAAYRHVVSIFREHGATNARWVWASSGNGGAQVYYPGDDVVDYVGMTVLGDEGWDLLFDQPAQPFRQLMAPKYSGLAMLGKPMIIAELGVSGTEERRQRWLSEAAQALPEFPQIRAVVYYEGVNAPNNHMATQPDWRVGAALFADFQAAIAGLSDG